MQIILPDNTQHCSITFFKGEVITMEQASELEKEIDVQKKSIEDTINNTPV